MNVTVADKKILVVDDDPALRTILEKTLVRHNHKPAVAETAKQAQQMIGLEEFDLVISDIRMPDMNGIQLLHWIKANSKVPVVLMTGFSEILETQEAERLGAKGFLAKPFKTEDLITTISACFPEEKKSEALPKAEETTYCKINIDEFTAGKEMKFDIFIKLNEGKFIKIAHAGEDIPIERIQSYKSKNIRVLHVKKEDFKKYIGFSMSLLEPLSRARNIEQQKKINFIKHTTEMVLQSLHTKDLSQDDYFQSALLVENTVDLLCDQSMATNLLQALCTHSDHLYTHSVGVSFYAPMIGKALGWHSPLTAVKLSLGGLLHDIGKKEIPTEILKKSRTEMTADEVALVETHPIRGAEILSQMPHVPTDIYQIAHQHHENCTGLGYPSHLSKNDIHPLAKVVSVANDFCNLALKNPNSPGMTPAEAIHKMLNFSADNYDSEAFRALMRIFKVSQAYSGKGQKDRS